MILHHDKKYSVQGMVRLDRCAARGLPKHRRGAPDSHRGERGQREDEWREAHTSPWSHRQIILHHIMPRAPGERNMLGGMSCPYLGIYAMLARRKNSPSSLSSISFCASSTSSRGISRSSGSRQKKIRLGFASPTRRTLKGCRRAMRYTFPLLPYTWKRPLRLSSRRCSGSRCAWSSFLARFCALLS